MHTTIEALLETAFFVQSVPRTYSNDELTIREGERLSSQLKVGEFSSKVCSNNSIQISESVINSVSVSWLHQVSIGFSDLNEMFVGQSGFYGLHFT
jgi:hypothetical protein